MNNFSTISDVVRQHETPNENSIDKIKSNTSNSNGWISNAGNMAGGGSVSSLIKENCENPWKRQPQLGNDKCSMENYYMSMTPPSPNNCCLPVCQDPIDNSTCCAPKSIRELCFGKENCGCTKLVCTPKKPRNCCVPRTKICDPCEPPVDITDAKSFFLCQTVCKPVLIVTVTDRNNMLYYRNKIIKNRSKLENIGGKFIGLATCLIPSTDTAECNVSTILHQLFLPSKGLGLVRFNDGRNALYFCDESKDYREILDISHPSTTFGVIMSGFDRSSECHNIYFVLCMYGSYATVKNVFNLDLKSTNVSNYGGGILVETDIIHGIHGGPLPQYVVIITWRDYKNFCSWYSSKQCQEWLSRVNSCGTCEYVLAEISQKINIDDLEW